MLSQNALLLVRAATEGAEEAAVNPWLVGIIVLVLFLGALGGLIAFGGGREHS